MATTIAASGSRSSRHGKPRKTYLIPPDPLAYGAMGLPLTTVLWQGDIPNSGLAWAVAIVAAFLALEPVLILCGRRGRRSQERQASSAMFGLAILGALAVAAGIYGCVVASAGARWCFLGVLTFAIVGQIPNARRHPTTAAECLSATTWCMLSLPVALVNGSAWGDALITAALWCVIWVAAVLTVAGLVAFRNRGSVGLLLWAPGILGAAAGIAYWSRGQASPMVVLPSLFVALALAISRPSPRHLTLVRVCLLGAGLGAVLLLLAPQHQGNLPIQPRRSVHRPAPAPHRTAPR